MRSARAHAEQLLRRLVAMPLAGRTARSLDVSAGYASIEGADVDVRWSLFDRFGRADTLALEKRIEEALGLKADLKLRGLGEQSLLTLEIRDSPVQPRQVQETEHHTIHAAGFVRIQRPRSDASEHR